MRIAVIGAGISGIGAALALAERHDVTLFEKDQRFGGHANTQTATFGSEEIAVDTGFIVFNAINYPNLTALFQHLRAPTHDSDMSFGFSLDEGRLEYACDSLDKVFTQRARVLDPGFLWVFAEILRFNRVGQAALVGDAIGALSLADWLDQHRFSRRFRSAFLYPMGGAIWSTPAADMGRFPARAFLQFFHNHQLLNGLGKAITWRTVTGGSRVYVEAALRALGPRAIPGVGAVEVRRLPTGQQRVRFDDGSEGVFDQVVLATHSDQSLALLADADATERALLGAVRYAPNRAALHSDANLMPRRRRAWSSWSFLAQTGREAAPPAVTYWMNRLQGLPAHRPLFVTLNPPREPDPALTHGWFDYAHPQFDAAAFDAQARMAEIQGRGGVWHAGAWLGWGFHEDGLTAGLKVAAALGARPAWAADLGAPLRPDLAIAAE